MELPVYAIQVGKNDFIERGWYRVAAENEERAITILMYEYGVPIDMKDSLNIVDCHLSLNGVIFW